MLRPWLLLPILILQLCVTAIAYMIDQDCGEDTNFVKDRIDAAFRLLDNTVTELSRPVINTDIDNLHNTLFGRPIAATNAIKSRFESLQPLRTYTTNDRTAGGLIDVRFYCTINRIEKRDEIYWNKDRNIQYKDTELQSEHAHCFEVKEPTIMITFTNPAVYSEIQICPWYLKKVRGKKLDLSDFGSSVLKEVSRIVMPVVAKLRYTPIDAFSLMDKTILHELTHTDQAGHIEDQHPKPYGFKNCVIKAQRYVQDNSQPDPLQNADSNSLFAVGTWIIAKGGGPIRPAGTFNPPNATPKPRF